MTGDRRDAVAGAGWEYVHVAIDDHSRIAFSAIYPNEKADAPLPSCTRRWCTMRGLASISRPCLLIIGPAYRSCAFAQACRALGIKHRFTRP